MGKFSNCCCVPRDRRLGMVQEQHFGYNPFTGTEYDISYASVAPGDIPNCFSSAMNVGVENIDTSQEMTRRFLNYRTVITQTTEYGDLRWNVYEIRRDPRCSFLLYESTEDSFGYIQRWEREWGVPTVYTNTAGTYPEGSSPAKDNATLLATTIKITRRSLTISQQAYLFRVEGTMIGIGPFLYEEEVFQSGPNTDADVMGYANELLALYDLDASTFNGSALATRADPDNGWLTNGYTADGSEEAGFVMTPVAPVEYPPGVPYSMYDLVATGVGTVIGYEARNPGYMAYSACMVDPVGDTPYAFTSKIFYTGEAGVCVQRLKLLSYDTGTHDKVTYQSVINCSEIIPCTVGCEIGCDQFNEICVVYPWSEWDNIDLFHTIPACCSTPP